MCSYLQDTWKKIKEDSPSKETITKATGTVVLAYASVLLYYHRKSIASFVSEKTRSSIEYLKSKSCNCSTEDDTTSSDTKSETSENSTC